MAFPLWLWVVEIAALHNMEGLLLVIRSASSIICAVHKYFLSFCNYLAVLATKVHTAEGAENYL